LVISKGHTTRLFNQLEDLPVVLFVPGDPRVEGSGIRDQKTASSPRRSL
jgi:hypothetical protein